MPSQCPPRTTITEATGSLSPLNTSANLTVAKSPHCQILPFFLNFSPHPKMGYGLGAMAMGYGLQLLQHHAHANEISMCSTNSEKVNLHSGSFEDQTPKPEGIPCYQRYGLQIKRCHKGLIHATHQPCRLIIRWPIFYFDYGAWHY